MKSISALLLSLTLTALALGDDWPQWMGPQRDGVWRETGILTNLPPNGPQVRWRTPTQAGYSGPAVVDGRVFIMDRTAGPKLERKPGDKSIPALAGRERVACFSSADGRLIWEHSYDSSYRIDYPAGPRTTPVVHDHRVFTLGAMGDLLCLNATNGSMVWCKSLTKEYHLENPPVWGWAAHPLVEGGNLISLVGGTNSAVAAFDLQTGREVWHALTTREIGYAPPIVCEAAGRRQLIVWHSEGVAGLDPANGAVHWTIPYPTVGKPQRPEVTVAMPRVSGDKLFLTSFYHGALMLRLDQDKPGASVLWNRKSASQSPFEAGLHTTMSTPLLQDGLIFGICAEGELRCLDAQTGDRLWESYEAIGGKKGFFASAFLLRHQDRCFIWNDQGDLILARLSRERYQELSRAHLLDSSETARGREVVWCAPAFAEKCFFARSQKELICVSLVAPDAG